MRRGTSFERALKVTGLIGLALAIGAGQAAAQIAVKSVKIIGADSRARVPEGRAMDIEVTLANAVPLGTASQSVSVAIFQGALGGSSPNFEFQDLAAVGATGQAESNDLTLGAATFPIPTGQMSGVTRLIVNDDIDAVNEAFRVAAVAGTSAPTAGVIGANDKHAAYTILDNETQEYRLRLNSTETKESASFDILIESYPTRPTNEDEKVFLGVTTGYSVGNWVAVTPSAGTAAAYSAATGITFDAASNHSVDVTIKARGNDRNRTDDTFTLTLYTGTTGAGKEVNSIDVTVLDVHQLPAPEAITAEARDDKDQDKGQMITTVEEGGKFYLFVTVENTLNDRVSDTENFTVNLTPSSQAQLFDYKVSPSSINLDGSNWFNGKKTIGPFTVEALADDDVGDETIELNLNVNGSSTYGGGTSMSPFKIGFIDVTMKQVEAMSDAAVQAAVDAAMAASTGDEGLNPGESFEIMTADLFTVADGYMATYGASSNGTAASVSASATSIMINAMEAGMATISVTATAEASSAIPQTRANLAQVTFDVTVVDKALVVTLSGPEDTNLVEGMSYEVMAETNRPVSEDVMIELMQSDGTASPADFEIGGMITIEAGGTMGSAMLTVVEDGMSDSGETLTIEARMGTEKLSGTLMFHLWDAAVPALPVIAQLILAAFLAVGGFRRFRRRF